MKKAVPIATLCAALSFTALPLAAPADAQTICGPRQQLTEMLRKQFEEVPKAAGIAGPSALVELLVAPDGSWTLLLTSSEGRACVLSGGTDWIERPAQQAKAQGPEL